jgi:hypothetical protein
MLDREKGTGAIGAKHPSGRWGKLRLSPAPGNQRREHLQTTQVYHRAEPLLDLRQRSAGEDPALEPRLSGYV